MTLTPGNWSKFEMARKQNARQAAGRGACRGSRKEAVLIEGRVKPLWEFQVQRSITLSFRKTREAFLVLA